MIPLATVADIDVRKASQRIVRRDGQRIFEVFARVNVDSMGDINEKVQDEFLPGLQVRYPALQIIKGGWEEQQAEFITEVTRLFSIAMLTIYVLLAVAFRSYTLPVIIMVCHSLCLHGRYFWTPADWYFRSICFPSLAWARLQASWSTTIWC